MLVGVTAAPDNNYTTAAHDDDDNSSIPGPFNAAGISVAKDFDTGTHTASQGEHTLSLVALVSDNNCVQVQNESFIP